MTCVTCLSTMEYVVTNVAKIIMDRCMGRKLEISFKMLKFFNLRARNVAMKNSLYSLFFIAVLVWKDSVRLDTKIQKDSNIWYNLMLSVNKVDDF